MTIRKSTGSIKLGKVVSGRSFLSLPFRQCGRERPTTKSVVTIRDHGPIMVFQSFDGRPRCADAAVVHFDADLVARYDALLQVHSATVIDFKAGARVSRHLSVANKRLHLPRGPNSLPVVLDGTVVDRSIYAGEVDACAIVADDRVLDEQPRATWGGVNTGGRKAQPCLRKARDYTVLDVQRAACVELDAASGVRETGAGDLQVSQHDRVCFACSYDDGCRAREGA